ncbi:CPBP family intramembrane metalloprotease [Francisellaceae bacterium]|nr:CPBP family intramembrane metalloprotease [Francisellaceae bacterium]
MSESFWLCLCFVFVPIIILMGYKQSLRPIAFALLVLNVLVLIIIQNMYVYSLFFFLILALLLHSYQESKNHLYQFLFGLGIIFVSIAIILPFAGWHIWFPVIKYQVSAISAPYTMGVYFQKAFIACLFILICRNQFFDKLSTLIKAIYGQWYIILITAVSLILPGILLGFISFEIKWNHLFWFWALTNLFFVCFTEEILFRGILLKQFIKLKFPWWLALVLSSVIFGCYHYRMGYLMIIMASIAGVFYGWAYLKTKSLEGAIFLHFSVNGIQFLFFTYPYALR